MAAFRKKRVGEACWDPYLSPHTRSCHPIGFRMKFIAYPMRVLAPDTERWLVRTARATE